METTTAATQERGEVRALREATLCGAFQATAADHGERVAIRTKDDGLSISWREYADRVRAAAGIPVAQRQ